MERMTHERLVTIVTDEIALMLGRGDISEEEEDQILTCLERAYQNLDQVRVPHPAAVRCWLLRILRSVRADRARERARWPQPLSLAELDRVGSEPACHAHDPALLTLGREQRRRIRYVQQLLEQVLVALGDERAWLFRSRFYDELSVSEVAARLGISQQAVAMRYRRVHQRVFRQLGQMLQQSAPDVVEFFTVERDD